MPEVDQFICIAAAIVGVQFVAAILGPGPLRLVTTLAVLVAGGLAAYAFYLGQTTPYPGEQTDSFEHATQFGIIAGVALVAHFILGWLFRCIARASAA